MQKYEYTYLQVQVLYFTIKLWQCRDNVTFETSNFSHGFGI